MFNDIKCYLISVLSTFLFTECLLGFTCKQQVIEDIGAALNLWLSISICFESDRCNMVSENTILLLYNVVDLLSVKVCLHAD